MRVAAQLDMMGVDVARDKLLSQSAIKTDEVRILCFY